MQRLSRRLRDQPLVEQDLSGGDTPGSEHGLVSRYALAIGSGRDRAILVVGHGAVRPRGFTNLCLRVGRSIADAAEVLLSQALAREELARERDQFAREARTDELTGLANRVAWTEALDQERPRRSRYRRPVVVMSVDVDGLKQANDRFGHDAGDELLRGVAGILRRNLRDADVVARIGGDEFGVLLPETQPDAMPTLGGAHPDRLCRLARHAAGPAPVRLDRLGRARAVRRPARSVADRRRPHVPRQAGRLTSGYHAGNAIRLPHRDRGFGHEGSGRRPRPSRCAGRACRRQHRPAHLR